MEIDFSKYQKTLKTYRGASGSKISIIYNDELYMLKFPANVTKQHLDIVYSNSSINEYIGCHIFENLCFDTQKTLLGKFEGKIVVACRDFEINDYRFYDFGSLKNTVIDSESNGYGMELKDILEVFDKQNYYQAISPSKIKKHFWEMFVADALLANYDRHNGNWGFLYNDKTNDIKFAPIFDCGSCLFPLTTKDAKFKEILENPSMQAEMIYNYPPSAIRLNKTTINNYDFLTRTDNQDCLNALVNINERIDMEAICRIIDETPYISDLHKDFLKLMLSHRKEKILEQAIIKNKNINQSVDMNEPSGPKGPRR